MVTGGGGASMPMVVGGICTAGLAPVPNFSAIPVRKVATDQDSTERGLCPKSVWKEANGERVNWVALARGEMGMSIPAPT